MKRLIAESYCGSSDWDIPNVAVEILMRILPRKRIYEPTEPNVTMKRLIAAIESVKDNSYDLAIWNCNHFANLVVQCLQGRPEPVSKQLARTASRDSKWWNDTSHAWCGSLPRPEGWCGSLPRPDIIMRQG